MMRFFGLFWKMLSLLQLLGVGYENFSVITFLVILWPRKWPIRLDMAIAKE